MGWQSLVVGLGFGLGVLLVYDALVRPSARIDIKRKVGNIGPRWAGAVAGAAAGFFLTTWVVAAIAGAVAGLLLPSIVVHAKDETRRLQRMDAIAEVAGRLRDSIRSGIGIYDAVSQAAANAPSCIQAEMRRLAAESRVSGLGQAASSFAGRVGPDAELLGSALTVGEQAGAKNTSDVLDALAEATTARASTLREARARQARAKASARIVAAVPILLLLLMRRSNPAYLEPFSTVHGQLVLGAAFALIAAGYAVMLRVSKLEVRTR